MFKFNIFVKASAKNNDELHIKHTSGVFMSTEQNKL